MIAEWQERLEREEWDRRRAARRRAEISAKRRQRHPLYPSLKVDMRTQAEVEETRELKALDPIIRLHRKATKKGGDFEVKKDLDGAYRLRGRLDERRSLQSVTEAA